MYNFIVIILLLSIIHTRCPLGHVILRITCPPQLAGEFKGASRRSNIDNPSEMEDYIYMTLSSITFKRESTYPEAFDKNQRRVLRRKSQEHFKIDSGVLYYSNVSSKATATGKLSNSENCRSLQRGEAPHSGVLPQ